MATVDSVREQALAMGPLERAALLEDLHASFDPASRDAIDAACVTEVEDRIDAYDRGELASISIAESKRRLSGG